MIGNTKLARRYATKGGVGRSSDAEGEGIGWKQKRKEGTV